MGARFEFFQNLGNRNRRACVNDARRHELHSGAPGSDFESGRAVVFANNVEGDKWFVGQLVNRAVGLHQPFATDAFAF